MRKGIRGDEHLQSIRKAATMAARAGGYGLMGIAAVICVDTILRKVLQISLVGTTELSSFVFCFATGVALAFAVLSKAHIRVDVVQRLLPTRIGGALDILAAFSLVCVSPFLAWNEGLQLQEALDYGATSTLLNIPLWIPHSLFLAGLLFFAATSSVAFVAELYRFCSKRSRFCSELASPPTDDATSEHPREN